MAIVNLTPHVVTLGGLVFPPSGKDVASPGDQVRDAEGRIVGCANFVVNK